MPLEIKELHIKLTVNTNEQSTATQLANGTATGSGAQQAGSNEAIVAECVEQVLFILQQKYER